jgi:hypothetical protein
MLSRQQQRKRNDQTNLHLEGEKEILDIEVRKKQTEGEHRVFMRLTGPRAWLVPVAHCPYKNEVNEPVSHTNLRARHETMLKG